MPAILRSALKALLIFGAALAIMLALIWPWPAPAVDWRTPVEAALAKSDCSRVATILNAAVGADSIEAMDLHIELASRKKCMTLDRVPGRREVLLLFRSRPDVPIEQRYSLDQDGLGFWHYHTARAAMFLCARPYDTGRGTDFALLSEALPDEAGWIMALHRQRRNLCAAVLAQVAAGLVAEVNPVMKKAAFRVVFTPPLFDSHMAASSWRRFYWSNSSRLRRQPPFPNSLSWIGTLRGPSSRMQPKPVCRRRSA